MHSEGESESVKSPVKLSLALAGGLLALVAGLNFISSPEVPVSLEEFQKLVREERVLAIKVSQVGLICELDEPIRFDNEGREVQSKHVLLAGHREVPPEQISEWRSRGIAVQFDDQEGVTGREWGGVGLVGGLLALGVWHLWSQIQKDRKGVGSPRRRLEALEAEYQAGRISLADYQKMREAIWAEM